MITLLAIAYILFGCSNTFYFSRDERAFPRLMLLTAGCAAFIMLQHLYLAIAFIETHVAYGVLGGTLIASGIILHIWCLWVARNARLGIAFSSGRAVELLMKGPYSIVRHPIYCSYLFVWIGGAISACSPWAAVGIPPILLLYLSAIRHEERALLTSNLGNEYSRYMTSVGMLWPRLFGNRR
jgi:protein-S-isoprenylcysteine O-methyltransferase Ste14